MAKQSTAKQSTAKAKQPKQPPPHPLDVIRRARDEHGIRRVVVGVSGGKDSVACLSLCHEHFDEVQAYFLYFVPGLDFQEDYLRYIERRFAPLSIIRLPHWSLSYWFQDSLFRHPTAAKKTKLVKIRDIEEYLRQKTGIDWTSSGEKALDSVERNAILRRANGIDPARRKFWPLCYWNHAAVFNYLKLQGIALAPEYSSAGSPRSFGSLWAKDIAFIKEKFPADFAKIKKMFPLIESQLIRHGKSEKGGGG